MESAPLSVEKIPLMLFLLMVPTALIQPGNCQSADTGCPSSATCDSSATGCYGFGDMTIKCANGTVTSFGTCYLSDLCPSADADQGNDWIRITANNINPKQCYGYSTPIKQNLMSAYNTWCCLGDNYLKCCPGSIAWPAGLDRSPANCAAMQNANTEVAYVAAVGSATQTLFLIQFKPLIDSPMCGKMVYANTSGSSGRGSAGATAAATTAAPAAAPATTTSTTATTTSTTTTTTTVTTITGTSTATTSTGTKAYSANNSTTTIPATVTTSRSSRRKREAWQEAIADSFNVVDNGEPVVETALEASSSQRGRRAVPTTTITLDASTVQLLIAGINVQNIIVTTIATASNGTISVMVTVTQNVSPASTLSPDKQANAWVIATGTICGILAALVCAYLIACAVHRSKNKGDQLPL